MVPGAPDADRHQGYSRRCRDELPQSVETRSRQLVNFGPQRPTPIV